MIIQFNNFTSALLDIDNGCNQGDPTSVILYHFYNVGLIDIAIEKQTKLAPAFIDDVTFLVGGKNFSIMANTIHQLIFHHSQAWVQRFSIPRKTLSLFKKQPRFFDALPDVVRRVRQGQ